jgi:serine protease Do
VQENGKSLRLKSVNVKCFLVIFSGAVSLMATAQQSLDSAYRTSGSAVLAAFEAQRLVLQTSSAVMLSGREEIGYGVVVSADGMILTKASEIASVKELSITVDTTLHREVKVLAVNSEWDVALVKIDAHDLIPVIFAPTDSVSQGTWVVANGATSRSKRRVLAGIVSAKTREIPATGGAALGVILNAKMNALVIEEVNEKSGAKEAGLQKGDVILSIEGKSVKKIEEISEQLKSRRAGTTVKILFSRDDKEMSADVRLAARAELFSEQKNRNDEMSGDFSIRRSGFPRVMQHDILGSRQLQGGPLLDLDGRCLGMNIARANRAESFAIPAEDLKKVLEGLIAQAAR